MLQQEQREVSYLHLWKPRPLSTGLSFLPTFHCLVLPQDHDPDSTDLTVQLMTYHGKVILEDQISIPDRQDEDGAPSGYDIIQGLADDKYLLCAGIDQVIAITFARGLSYNEISRVNLRYTGFQLSDWLKIFEQPI